MKQFYCRFRVMLLTFTFGLAVVPFSNAVYEKWGEIPVNLPEVESDFPIVVMIPTERRPFNIDYGAGCRGGESRSIGRFVVLKGKKAKDNRKKKQAKLPPATNKNRN